MHVLSCFENPACPAPPARSPSPPCSKGALTRIRGDQQEAELGYIASQLRVQGVAAPGGRPSSIRAADAPAGACASLPSMPRELPRAAAAEGRNLCVG